MLKEVGLRPTVVRPGSVNSPAEQNPQQMRVPAEGKLVLLQVLERTGEMFKVLINGSVFTTALPVNAKNGDRFAAKVLLSNPLTLDLNTGAGLKIADTSALLSLLGLDETEFSSALTGKLIEEGMPLSQEKISQYSSFMQREQLKTNEQVMMLLASMYKQEGVDPELFNKKPLQLFAEMPETIVENLYRIIRDLNSSSNSRVQAVLGSLIVESPAIKEAFASETYAGVVMYLDTLSGTEVTAEEYSLLTALKVTLAKFVMKCAVYAWFGLYPGCVIRKENDKPVVFYFLNSRETESSGSSYIRLRLFKAFGIETADTFSGYIKNRKVIAEYHPRNSKRVDEHKANLVKEALSVFGFEGTVITRINAQISGSRKRINIAV